jgi:general transcription factor 3C polypeptide 3 (transcription factor C subunit 4)
VYPLLSNEAIYAEANQAHASIVLGHEIVDYAPLFVEIADAYFDREMYAQARPIYELLGQDAGVCSTTHFCHLVVYIAHRQVVCMFSSRLLHVTICSDNFKTLLRCMKPVSISDFSLLRVKHTTFLVLSLDASLNDVKMRLAGIYEVLHEPRKALDLVYQGEFCPNIVELVLHI